MITLVISMIFIACYIFQFWNTYSYWKKRGIVGPTPWPIVGNYGPILFRCKREYQFIAELYNKYPEEKFIGIYIGTKPVLILRDIEITKLVYNKAFPNFADRYVSPTLAEYSKVLLLSSGDENWKQNRKNLSYLSKQQRMNGVADAIEYTSKYFFDYVDKRLETSPQQDIFQLQEDYFYAITCHAILGKKINIAFDNKLQRRIRLLENFLSSEMRYCLEIVFPWITKVYKCFTNVYFSKVANFYLSLIEDRKNKPYRETSTFVDLILDLQEQKNSIKDETLDDDTVALHMITTSLAIMLFTSRAASYLLFVMAKHSDIQNKCYDEINQVLQKYDGKICFESISEMKYFDMVLQEVMRIYGNSFIENRLCTTKYHFPGLNLQVDPGTLLYVPMECYRSDPKLFPNPDKIIPERFAPENLDKLPLGTNLAFGYGRRNCMGKPIAMFVLKMYAAAFVHRFKVKPDGTIDNLRYNPNYRFRKPAKDQRTLNIIHRKN